MDDDLDCGCAAGEECKGFDGECAACSRQHLNDPCPRGGLPPAGQGGIVEVIVDELPPHCAVHVEATGPNLAVVCGAEADEDDIVLRTSPAWLVAHDGVRLTVRWRELWLGPR